MMRLGSPRQVRAGLRSAFTLFEMILAMSIGLVILFALYLTLEMNLTSAQIGRDLVQDGTLARAVLTRVTNDVVCNLGAVDPKALPEGTSTTETDAAPSSSSSSTSSSAAKEVPVSGDSMVFNLGVQGQASQLVLYVSRVPRELNLTGSQGQAAKGFASDLRRITYWIADGGAGLARQEVVLVTGQEMDTYGPNSNNPKVIAPEVKGIKFEYFDGLEWQESWNGDANEGETDPLLSDVKRGPPAAIAVTITIERPVGAGMQPLQRTYRQVIAIPAGNNYPQAGNS